jgi:hypothetical protein
MSEKREVSDQWNVGSISDVIGGLEEMAAHQHGPGCGHDLDAMEAELDDRPPDNAGIVETVRWAMENGKVLTSPPVDHMFCGTSIPCIYAGTIPTRTFLSTPNARRAAIRHAEDFVSIVMCETKEPDRAGMPKQSRYPSLSAFMVVLDVNSDPDDPSIHLLIYDGPKSAASGQPVVGYIEDAHRAVSVAKKGDACHGLREIDLEAFLVDLTAVVRDHLRRRMLEQEEAIREAQAAGVEVIDRAAPEDRPEIGEPDFEVAPGTSNLDDNISRMERRIEGHQVSREGRKKLERKIAAMKAKRMSLTQENMENGEDSTVVSA